MTEQAKKATDDIVTVEAEQSSSLGDQLSQELDAIFNAAKDSVSLTTDAQEGDQNADEVVSQASDPNVASDGSSVPLVEPINKDEVKEDLQEPGTITEVKPLADRLEEFESKYKPKQADSPESDLRTTLQTHAEQLKAREQALHSYNFEATLPKGGVYEVDGKSVFELSHKELNDYLINLQDQGHAFAAGQVQTEYLKAVERAKAVQAEYVNLDRDKATYDQNRHFVEWQEMKAEVKKHFPEITQQDFDSIGNFIDQNTNVNPAYKAALTTYEGKIQKGVEALDKLGILSRFKQSVEASQPVNTTPSAPDAKVKSKKVNVNTNGGNTNYNSADVKKMSQKDFNSIPDDVLDRMLSGEI